MRLAVTSSAEDLVIGYDRPLTGHVNLEMERQKIAIVGANGIGKTTYYSRVY